MVRNPENRLSAALIFGCAISFWLLSTSAGIAKNDDDGDRFRFYGWVDFIPEGFHGIWIIGGREVTTNPRTEFDESEGPLMVGGCAKVDMRGGLVHEIDSEPPRDCR